MNEIQKEIVALMKEGILATDERISTLRNEMLSGKTASRREDTYTPVVLEGCRIADDVVVHVANTSMNAITHGKPLTDKVNSVAFNKPRKNKNLSALSAIYRIRGCYIENGVEYAVDENGKDIQFTQKWKRVDHIALATSYDIDTEYKPLKPMSWKVHQVGSCDGVDYYDADTPVGMLRLVNYKQLDDVCVDNPLDDTTKIVVLVDGKPTITLDWYESYADSGSSLYRGMLDASFPDIHEAWLELGGHHIIAAKTSGEQIVYELTHNIIKMCESGQ